MDFNRGYNMPRDCPRFNGPNDFKFPPPPPMFNARGSPYSEASDSLSDYTTFNNYTPPNARNRRYNDTTDAASLPPIGVFWDIENCQIPHGKSALAAAQAIRDRFFHKYREAEFVVVCDITKESKQVVQELEDAQVNLMHAFAKSKNACDEKLRQAMRRFGDTHTSPAAIILITSDVNFATDLSDLKNRKKLHIILIHNERCADALILSANEHYNFKQLLDPIARRELLEDPTTEVIVTNLPPNADLRKVSQRLKILSENTGGKIKELTETFAVLSFPTFESASRGSKRMDGEDINGSKILAAIRHNTEAPKVAPPKNRYPQWSNENFYDQGFYQPYNQQQFYGYQGNEVPPDFLGLKNYEKSAGKNRLPIEEISEQTSAFEKNVRGKGKRDQAQNLKPDFPKEKDINEKTAEKLKKDENICCLHDKRNIKDGYVALPNVMVTLEKFTRDVLDLLESHNNHIPLISFYECYKSVCGPLSIDEKGVPLEHMITCLDHVTIANDNGNKVVKTSLKHVVPKDEKFLKSSTTTLPNSLVHLSSEIMDLIRLQPSAQLPLGQLNDRYQSLYKKGIKLSDYGFSNTNQLMEAMSDLIQILGSKDKKTIMISHKEQLRRFYKTLILVLDREPSRSLLQSDIPSAFEKLKQPFQPVDYGLCYFEDLLISVSDALHCYMSGSNRIICKKEDDGNKFNQNKMDNSKALLNQNAISLPLDEISEQSTKFEELRDSAKKQKKQKPVETQEKVEKPGLLNMFKKLFVDDTPEPIPENSGKLSKSSSTTSVSKVDAFCSLHSNENSLKNNEIFRVIINLSLKTFALNVNVLMSCHEDGIPLKSFVDCYRYMFGALQYNENGVPIEHLLSCIDCIKLVQKNAVKYVIKTTEKIKHIDTENFMTDIEVNKFSHLGYEAIILLQNQKRMELPFDQFVPNYHKHFERQLKLSDYNIAKFATLMSHISNYVQVLGEGPNKVLTITHVFNIRRFFIELSELLEAQSTKSLLSSKFLQVYKQTYGKAFNPCDFGLCYLDDLLDCLSGFVTVLPLKQDKLITFNPDTTVGDQVSVSPQVIEQKLIILSHQILDLVYPYYPNGLPLDTLLTKHQLKFGSMLETEFHQCSNLEGFVNSLPSVKVVQFQDKKMVVPRNGQLFDKVFKIVNALIQLPGGRATHKELNDFLSCNHISRQNIDDIVKLVPDVINITNAPEPGYSLSYLYQFARSAYEVIWKEGDATVQAIELSLFEAKYFEINKKKIQPSKYGFRTTRQLLSAFPRNFSLSERSLFYFALEKNSNIVSKVAPANKVVNKAPTPQDPKDQAKNDGQKAKKAMKKTNKMQPGNSVATQPADQKPKNPQNKPNLPTLKINKTKHAPVHAKAAENAAKPHKPSVKPSAAKKPSSKPSQSQTTKV